MYKRISIVAASFATIVGVTIGLVNVPASASATSPNYSDPVSVMAHPTVSSGTQVKTYKVRSGDSLSAIAAKFDINWRKLYCANRKEIGNQPSLIEPGERLKIRQPRHVWCSVKTEQVTPIQTTTVSSTPVTTNPTVVNYSGFGSFQQCVIMRESGGNPAAVNPYSGAGGLYQFLPSTWAALGFASAYPGGAQTAPVSVQNQAFAEEYAQSGTSAWAPYDGC